MFRLYSNAFIKFLKKFRTASTNWMPAAMVICLLPIHSPLPCTSLGRLRKRHTQSVLAVLSSRLEVTLKLIEDMRLLSIVFLFTDKPVLVPLLEYFKALSVVRWRFLRRCHWGFVTI